MNRTVKGAKQVHGKDPQLLIEKIIRERIFESRYWKEHCFGLTIDKFLELASELDHVGGVYGNQKPTPFLCLVLRLLQLQPKEEVVLELIEQEDFKYLRVLALLYHRLVVTPAAKVYTGLEPYLSDKRKIRLRAKTGAYELTFVDELVDKMLREDRAFDIILPRIGSRMNLEELDELEPRDGLVSEGELDQLVDEDEVTANEESLPPAEETGAAELSIEATNALRAKLGLKPLSE